MQKFSVGREFFLSPTLNIIQPVYVKIIISNDVKRSIVLNLCETKSMDLIAREHCVSPSSVARILRLTEDRRRKNYLPRILSIDEFKSVNTVDASMSVNLTDLEGGHIFDILVDRRQRYSLSILIPIP